MSEVEKTCKQCLLSKLISGFHKKKNGKFGVNAICKDCYNLKYRELYSNASPSEIEARKERRLSESAITSRKKTADSEKRKLYIKQYVNQPEIRAKINKSYRERNKDPIINLANRCRARLKDSLKKNGYGKKSKTNTILGCVYEFFKQHIESQFADGMSWDRFDEIHLDHFIPIALASTEEDVLALNHYTNIQPLWAEDNLKKSDSIPTDKEIESFFKDNHDSPAYIFITKINHK